MDETPPRDPNPYNSAVGGDDVPPPPPLESLLPHAETEPMPHARARPQDRLEEWLDLLNNRLVLGALGLVAVLLLTVIVFLAIGRGDAGPSHSVEAIATSGGTPRLLGGLTGRVVATVSVRNGPNSQDILGTIPKSSVVAVVGRSEDSTWLQVRYPPNSTLRGWVAAQFLDVTGDISQLEVAGPGPGPSIDVPTSAPTYIAPADTATPAEHTPVGTPTPSQTPVPTAQPATPTTEPPATPTATPQP